MIPILTHELHIYRIQCTIPFRVIQNGSLSKLKHGKGCKAHQKMASYGNVKSSLNSTLNVYPHIQFTSLVNEAC